MLALLRALWAPRASGEEEVDEPDATDAAGRATHLAGARGRTSLSHGNVQRDDGRPCVGAESAAPESPLCLPRPQCLGAFRAPSAQVCPAWSLRRARPRLRDAAGRRLRALCVRVLVLVCEPWSRAVT